MQLGAFANDLLPNIKEPQHELKELIINKKEQQHEQ